MRNAGGSITAPRAIAIEPDREGEQRASRRARRPRRDLRRKHVAGKAGQAQRADRDDRHDDRHLAALPAGARRAEDRKAEHRERDRIERRDEAVMQLGAEMRSAICL